MDANVITQLAQLEQLPMSALRRKWGELFGTPSPGHNRTFLIKRLSYRIQELAYGALKPETRAQLDGLLEAAGYDDLGRLNSGPAAKRRADGILPGTLLIREFQGERHTVTVLEEGFEYRGKPYRSLSAIAREISGSQWNGPAFFGLRGKGKITRRTRHGQ